MEREKMNFPEGFLWGVATSSYQIEGGNSNTDWSEWERAGKTRGGECGRACDYWNLWKKDHELLSELGVGAFRLAIEWARVEPEDGKFSDEAIRGYREILSDLKRRNIRAQVTLWHWTSPLWFSRKYGFHNKKSQALFARYTEKIVSELGDLIDLYVVLNEPMVPLGMGYLAGEFPPGLKNPWKFWRALSNLAGAHKKTYDLIHKKYPEAKVGISYLYNWYEIGDSSFLEKIVNRITKWYRIDLLGNKIKNHQDYVGVDYYRLGKIIYDPKNSDYLGFRIEENPDNAMRWVTYAKGMYLVLKEAYQKYQKPIYIIENGVPTNMGVDDPERIKFIDSHLREVHRAIQDGVPVRGYNHWSFMDNFEWLEGYHPRFGLVEIDFATLERTRRKSFAEYGKICRNNGLDV